MLSATLILTLGGAILFWLAERDNLLSGMAPGEQALASLFQAVSPRTAGFNTVDLAKLTSGGGLLTIVLMFIGAGPGSTGGGVKVTTVAVCLLTLTAYIRGRREVGAFNRRLDEGQIHRAAAGVTLYITLALGGGFLVPEQRLRPLHQLDGGNLIPFFAHDSGLLKIYYHSHLRGGGPSILIRSRNHSRCSCSPGRKNRSSRPWSSSGSFCR